MSNTQMTSNHRPARVSLCLSKMSSPQLQKTFEDQLTAENQTTPSQNDSRERNKINLFTEQEEEDLVEWYKEQVFLYDKESKDHKNRDKKARVLEEKGRSMLPPVKGGQISTWIDTHRTRFCKLTTPKSGSGRPVLSVREKWIFEKFSFLKEHIKCVPQRQSQMFGMQPDQQETRGEQGEEAEEEVILEELEDAVVVATPSITVAPTVSTPSTSTTPAGKRKRTPTDDGALIEKL
ncbi:uncharacterized protein LOC126991475 [Eriocheir sinensis]|uniref:uncharacterized protein LOC126991475 n=1 Tax=Eriocheir sinensis TaxID=95602 RepID=UPI0021C68A6C|nr:uncharacterized protein LOC126991475 [Eriocheir sinensis]